jgi:hypothetical protein
MLAGWWSAIREVITPDSSHRSDSFGLAGSFTADTPPFPHQARTLGLQRFRIETHDSGEYRYSCIDKQLEHL